MRTFMLLLALAGCSSTGAPQPPPPKTSTTAPARDALTPEPSKSCVEQCVEKNQMRAVSPEMIRADCERECER